RANVCLCLRVARIRVDILGSVDFFKALIRRLPTLLLLVALILLAWKHTAALDWLKLRDYQPPTAISQLANTDTMTPSAVHIFYVNHPTLVSSNAQFAKDCPQIEQTIVLG